MSEMSKYAHADTGGSGKHTPVALLIQGHYYINPGLWCEPSDRVESTRQLVTPESPRFARMKRRRLTAATREAGGQLGIRSRSK